MQSVPLSDNLFNAFDLLDPDHSSASLDPFKNTPTTNLEQELLENLIIPSSTPPSDRLKIASDSYSLIQKHKIDSPKVNVAALYHLGAAFLDLGENEKAEKAFIVMTQIAMNFPESFNGNHIALPYNAINLLIKNEQEHIADDLRGMIAFHIMLYPNHGENFVLSQIQALENEVFDERVNGLQNLFKLLEFVSDDYLRIGLLSTPLMMLHSNALDFNSENKAVNALEQWGLYLTKAEEALAHISEEKKLRLLSLREHFHFHDVLHQILFLDTSTPKRTLQGAHDFLINHENACPDLACIYNLALAFLSTQEESPTQAEASLNVFNAEVAFRVRSPFDPELRRLEMGTEEILNHIKNHFINIRNFAMIKACNVLLRELTKASIALSFSVAHPN